MLALLVLAFGGVPTSVAEGESAFDYFAYPNRNHELSRFR